MVPVAIVLLVLLDQLVKWYVVKNIPLGVVKSFIPHVVSLTYLQNTGAAFSLLENQQWFFTLITLVVMVGAFYYLYKHLKGSLWMVTGLTLVIVIWNEPFAICSAPAAQWIRKICNQIGRAHV